MLLLNKTSKIVLLLFLCSTMVYAQDLAQEGGAVGPAANDTDNFKPNIKPNVMAQRIALPIVIDGVLDDAGWAGAGRAFNFSETFPGDQTRPPIDIETWVAYDDDNFYVAFKIDDDPAAVRRTLTDRDRIWQDDYVGIILDTYGNNAWAYFLGSNPLGIQGDTRIINNGGEDDGFNIVFKSEGQVTDEGYQVEMAIPFRSLRFPDKDIQNWNINFWITHPREDRNTYSWAGMDRDNPCWLCQGGSVSGIQEVNAGRNLELLPTLTGSQAGFREEADADFDNGKVNVDPSLGVKYGFTPNLTADLTLNPDFSQIEADAAQIDVNSTFALFFQERRPFFQEGSELFSTNIDQVYTRQINNPLAAAKLTGRFDKTSVAYIGARDRDTPMILPFEEGSEFAQAGESFSNILRVRRTFKQDDHLGVLVTDRRLDEGGAGSTFGMDGRHRFLNNYQFEWQVVGSHTEEPNNTDISGELEGQTFNDGEFTRAFDGESFSGFASYASVERNARHWSFDVDYWATNPTFRADNGFVTQNNQQRLNMYQGYTFYGDGFFNRFTPGVIVGRDWNFQNERKDEYMWLRMQLSMKGQTNMGLMFLAFSNEKFQGIDFRGLRRLNVWVNSNFSNPVRLGAFVSTGKSIARNLDVPEMGNSLNIEAWGTIKPFQRLVIEPRFNFAKLNEEDSGDQVFKGYIARTRLNYQFTRRLFLRLVTQYNDFNERFEIDPLLTYRINPFTAFYIGSTHDYDQFGDPFGVRQSARQFFFKMQYQVRA